jgi:lysylphosphatidylglycerol synthetase-like protein (DUF2156 family)
MSVEGISRQFSVESFAVKPILKGTSQILFVIAGLLLLVGGRAISEVTKLDWVFAEFLGMGLAAVFFVLGMMAKNAADDLDGGDSATQ